MLAIVLPLVALQVLALRRDRQAAEAAVYASLVGRAEDAAARVSNLFGRAEQLLGFLASREELRQLNVARCSELLAGAGDIADEYANIILVDAHGGLVCSSAPGAPASFVDTPWFRQGIGAPSYRLNDPQWGRISHRQVSLLTLPVIGHGGGTVGLVAVAIDLRALAEMLPRGGLPPEATLSVVKGQSLF